MIKATFETKHFLFEGYGTTEKDAFKALEVGWWKHAQQLPEADQDLLWNSADDVAYQTFELGQCFRDGQVIAKCAS